MQRLQGAHGVSCNISIGVGYNNAPVNVFSAATTYPSMYDSRVRPIIVVRGGFAYRPVPLLWYRMMCVHSCV